MKLGHHRDVRPPGSWKPKKTEEGFTPPPSQACVADENLLLYLCLLLLLLLVQHHAIPDVNIFKSEDYHAGSTGGRYADHDHLTHGAAGQIAHMNLGALAFCEPLGLDGGRPLLRFFHGGRLERD